MQLSVVGTNGPLFVLAESAEVTAFLAAHYPQFAKRLQGWQLSVEELYCLQSTAADHAADASRAASVSVSFTSVEAAAQYEELHEAYTVDCIVYDELTRRHGYKLRHGSAFGASYIGYQDIKRHGECLFFRGPLSGLEQLRAARIARSVGKTAIMVTLPRDGFCVTLVPIASSRAAADAMPAKKQRRRE